MHDLERKARTHKRRIESARRVNLQSHTREAFATLEEAWQAARADHDRAKRENSGEPTGWCVGVDLLWKRNGTGDMGAYDPEQAPQHYQLSGHIGVSDATWEHTRGLCWRCAWLAAWYDEHPVEEHPTYVCYVRGKPVVR